MNRIITAAAVTAAVASSTLAGPTAEATPTSTASTSFVTDAMNVVAARTKADLVTHYMVQPFAMRYFANVGIIHRHPVYIAGVRGKIFYASKKYRGRGHHTPWQRNRFARVWYDRHGTHESCHNLTPLSHDPDNGARVTIYLWNPVTGVHWRSKTLRLPCSHTTTSYGVIRLGGAPKLWGTQDVAPMWRVRTEFVERFPVHNKIRSRHGKERFPKSWGSFL